MQLGFVTAILGDLSLDDVLKTAADIGYDCIEVMCWPPKGGVDREYGGVCHIDCSDLTRTKADDVRGLCERHRVSISALGYYPNPLSHDDNEAQIAKQHLRKVIDAAVLLGLNVNTFIGANQHLPLDDNLRRFEETWPDIIRYAEDRNTRIAIENCPMLIHKSWPFGWNLARTPAIWRKMFEIIPSVHFGLNYDPSHLRMQLMDPIAPIHEFGPRLFHAHAKDMRIDHAKLDRLGSLVPPMDRSTAKIPGFGDISWGKWIGALADAGYDGPVCVEVEDEAFEGSPERRRKSLEISHRVLRPLIA